MLETLHAALRRQLAGSRDVHGLPGRGVAATATARSSTLALAGHPRPVTIGADGSTRAVGRHGTVLGVSGSAEPEVSIGIAWRRERRSSSTPTACSMPGAPTTTTRRGRPARRVPGAHAEPLGGLLERLERLAYDRAAGRPRDDIALLGLRLV